MRDSSIGVSRAHDLPTRGLRCGCRIMPNTGILAEGYISTDGACQRSRPLIQAAKRVLICSMPVQAELDAARAEGGREIVVQLESGGVLKVHPGQEVATDETTGTRYTVTWAQDDRGAISVRLPPLST